MSTYNIEMNMLNSSNGYDVLYPKTDYNQLLNKPTIPDTSNFVTSPVAIYEGGTGKTDASTGLGNLIRSCPQKYTWDEASRTSKYLPIAYQLSNDTTWRSYFVGLECFIRGIRSYQFELSTSETTISFLKGEITELVWGNNGSLVFDGVKVTGIVVESLVCYAYLYNSNNKGIIDLSTNSSWNPNSIKAKFTGSSNTLNVRVYGISNGSW